jgi:hypothetical protein
VTRKILGTLVLFLGFVGGAFAQVGTLYGSAFIGAGGPATLYRIDKATAVATAVGPIGFNRVGALAMSPTSGVLYGIGFDGADSILIRINPASGVGALVGPLGAAASTQDMAFRSDGTLFAYVEGDIYTVNTVTGAATLVGGTGGFPDGNALAFQAGTLLLANTGGGGNGTLQSVNQATGAVTVIVPLAYGGGFTPANNPRAGGMKIDPLSGILFAGVIETGGARFLGRINTTTGAVTDVGATVAGLDAIAFALPIPAMQIPTLSPLALVLMAAIMAAAGLYFMRRTGG